MISKRALSMKPSGIRKYFALASKIEGCIDCSIGQPDFPVEDNIKTELLNIILDGRNKYTQSLGLESARAAVKEKYSINSDDYNVIISSGVSGGLYLVYSAILDPGDEILIPDPYFIGYKELSHLLNAIPVPCDTYPNFILTPEILDKYLTSKTKAVIVGSPSNPTGVSLTKEQVTDLSSYCKQKGLYLIFDEIYEEFSYDFVHERPALEPHVIILNGLSKSKALMGWRLGWVVANSEIISQLEKIQQFTFVCAPSPFQEVITKEHLKPIPQTKLNNFIKRRDLVSEKLSTKYNFTKPNGAFYFFPEIFKGNNIQSGTEFVTELLNRKLLVIPGGEFSKVDTNFRLSFAVSDQMLERALDVLCSF